MKLKKLKRTSKEYEGQKTKEGQENSLRLNKIIKVRKSNES